MKKETEILIIGGGVVGTAIARRLSKYKTDITLVEKGLDVCVGTTKANTALLHAGFNADYNTLKGRLNGRGNKLYRQWEQELEVPIEWLGALVIAQNEQEVNRLEELLENGKKNGVKKLEIISKDKVFELEPDLNPDTVAALYAPTAGIVNPFELTVALANNAVKNGANVELDAEVLDIEVHDDYKLVKTAQGDIKAKLVINAAGVFADEIAKMVGINDFEITPRRGEYYLYDKKNEFDVTHTIFQAPSGVSKGVVTTPTDEGNLMIGPNAEEIDDKEDVANTQKGLDEILTKAKQTIPDISTRDVIKEFSGLRAAIKETEDFYIKASDKVKGFINVAGIQSPGLASAPAIAEMVDDIVQEQVKLKKDPNFDPIYKAIPKFRELSHEERGELIKENPDFGQIICRCETVSKAEILAAIRQPVGAQTFNAVKRRVRPGLGRCQGGFCEPKVVQLLAQELGIDETEVKLEEQNSNLLVDKTKQPLLKGVDSSE